MNFFKYIIPFVISFGLTVSLMPLFIGYFHLKGKGQKTAGNLKQHAKKNGTPTMGGVIFLISSALTCLISAFCLKLFTYRLVAILFVLISFGIIGFLDDFLKMKKPINEKGVNEGITDGQKFFAQVFCSCIFFIFLLLNNFSLQLNIFGIFHLNLGLFYAIFVIFWLVGFSNAVNLTDGIDGLVAILSMIALIAYGIIAFKQQQNDLLLIIIALIGAIIGFFLFNFKPAKIFMGDVGSLSLGAIFAALSILLHQEWTLLFIGIIFVIETASVMLQVVFFKLTHGKRIFRMTPIHHHFELGGFSGIGQPWNEWKIDLVFAFGSLLGTLLILFDLFVF